MTILEIRKISFHYGALSVLDNVSFSLNAGEKVALIGPNGAGKTTLLSVISGLLYPANGEINLFGRGISKLPPHRRVSLGLGRSFQINALFPKLTLLHNILLALRDIEASSFQMLRPLIGYKKRVAKARELLESVNLWEKRDLPIGFLSYGEQRQAEILLALASQPKILLLDEPSAGLTSEEMFRLVGMIRSFMKDTAVLFVAHDLDLVLELSDRVLVLYYGNIIAEGSPEEIQANPKVQEIYLGTETTVARTD